MVQLLREISGSGLIMQPSENDLANPELRPDLERYMRGKGVEEALDLLNYSTKKAAHLVRKILDSAIANAENNEGADVDELSISSIFVDEGTTMKRLRPRAKGRADRILKRSCHITVKVTDGEG